MGIRISAAVSNEICLARRREQYDKSGVQTFRIAVGRNCRAVKPDAMPAEVRIQKEDVIDIITVDRYNAI